MNGPIIVPLDGSQLSEHALSLAIVLARRDRLPLHLVRVHQRVPDEDYAPFKAVHDEIRQAEQDYLTNVANRLSALVPAEVYTAVLDGPIAPAIEAYAKGHRAALIVATTHGHGGLSRLWIGSTVDELVRLEGIPVLAQRPDEGQPDLTRVQGVRHLLIPLDGSADGEAVLPFATALGGRAGARYTLVQVVRATPAPAVVSGPWPPATPMPATAMVEQLVERAEAYLREVARRMHAAGVQDVRTMVVVDDHVAAALLRCISTYKTDLVAMATHGRGTSRLLVGSVADKVMRAAARPVLLVRPKRVIMPDAESAVSAHHESPAASLSSPTAAG